MQNQVTDNKVTSKLQEQKTKGAVSLNKIFIFSVLLVVILAGVVGYFMYSVSKDTESTLTTEEALTPTPYGTLMFTVLGDDELSIYSLALSTETKSLRKFETENSVASPEFTDKFNSTKLYFSASSVHTDNEADQIGLHSWDLGTNTFEYFEGASGNVERDINFSPATGLVAFYRLKDTVGGSLEARQIKDHEIVIFDPAKDSVVEIVDGGVNPRWSPTGEALLYLADDGLYVLDVNTRQRSKVIGPDESNVTITLSTTIDVSLDGKWLVLTSQGSGLIEVFNIQSWSPVLLQEFGSIADDTKFYFAPVISPDGAMYAVIATDRIGDVFNNPRLEIRSMLEGNLLSSVSLGNFDPEKIYIDDWVADQLVFN